MNTSNQNGYDGRKKPTILVVDDEPTIREAIRLILEKNFNIISASNGFEALEMYEKYKPDIVLMDIMMPIMNGIEATREILKKHPDAVILAISAYSDKKGEEIIKAGARDILPKPFRRRDLVDFLMKFINTASTTP